MQNFLLTILAAAIHELGHLLAAVCLKIPIAGISYSSAGPKIKLGRLLSFREEGIVAFAGPFFNFLTGVFFLFSSSEAMVFLGITSVFLGTLNLFPLKNTDGYRILSVLLHKLSLPVCEKICFLLSLLTLGIFWLISVYFLLKTYAAIMLFVFCGIMFLDMISYSAEKKNSCEFPRK